MKPSWNSLDLVGNIYGLLTVVERTNQIHHKNGAIWILRCECGNKITKSTKSLRDKKFKGIKGCGCVVESHHLLNRRFNKLTVIKYLGVFASYTNTKPMSQWECICDCGNKLISNGHSLLLGLKWHCGCARNIKNPKTVAVRVLMRSYKISAKYRNYEFNLTEQQCESLFEGDCLYCGIKPMQIKLIKRKTHPGCEFYYNGIDRVNNTLGYNIKNCVSCCGMCNAMKTDMDYENFIDHVCKIYNLHNNKPLTRLDCPEGYGIKSVSMG